MSNSNCANSTDYLIDFDGFKVTSTDYIIDFDGSGGELKLLGISALNLLIYKCIIFFLITIMSRLFLFTVI